MNVENKYITNLVCLTMLIMFALIASTITQFSLWWLGPLMTHDCGLTKGLDEPMNVSNGGAILGHNNGVPWHGGWPSQSIKKGPDDGARSDGVSWCRWATKPEHQEGTRWWCTQWWGFLMQVGDQAGASTRDPMCQHRPIVEKLIDWMMLMI
jgi:hypothetical protein